MAGLPHLTYSNTNPMQNSRSHFRLTSKSEDFVLIELGSYPMDIGHSFVSLPTNF